MKPFLGRLQRLFADARRWQRVTLKALRARMAFGLDDRADFYSLLYDIQSTGFPILHIVEDLSTTQYQLGKKKIARVFSQMTGPLRNGKSLPVALAPWVPPTELALLQAASKGSLGVALKAIAGVTRSMRELRELTIDAMAYPAFVIGAGYYSMYYFGSTIFRKFMEQYPDFAKTPIAVYYVHGSLAVADWYWLFPLVMVALVAVHLWALPNYTGRLRPYLDRYWPPFWFYRLIVAAGLVYSLLAYLVARVAFPHAIKSLRDHATPYLDSHLAPMSIKSNEGIPNANVLNTGLLPPTVIVMVRAILAANNKDEFESSMQRVADGVVRVFTTSFKSALRWVAVGTIVVMGTLGMATYLSFQDFGDAAAEFQENVAK